MIAVRLRLFATAREAAGCTSDVYEMADGAGLAQVLACASERYGAAFRDVLAVSRVWLNGDEPDGGGATALRDGDEIAVLPPVSGGI